MREIEVKTEGAWRPGPGAVYPVLQKLAKQGFIASRRKSSSAPTQVVYEITQAGLGRIADAKRMMKTSTERLSLISSLFVDLMDPEDLVRFVLGLVGTQIELIHAIIDSNKGGLTTQDKLFVLRQYRLNLERELRRAIPSIELLDKRAREEGSNVMAMARRRRKK